jgi:hypothetical protein
MHGHMIVISKKSDLNYTASKAYKLVHCVPSWSLLKNYTHRVRCESCINLGSQQFVTLVPVLLI